MKKQKITIEKIVGIELNGEPLYEVLNKDEEPIDIGLKEEMMKKYEGYDIFDVDKELVNWDAYIKIRSEAMRK